MSERKYFAACNSAFGFKSYYHEIFSRERLRTLFVIKGGPGTGKSRFMREVAQYAEGQGEDATYYYCSSDPESLDGVILEKSRIALIDATAPHVYEPKCIGVFEQIVNLGEFWDRKLLAESRAEIEAHSLKKNNAFAAVYAYLRAIGNLEAAIETQKLSMVKMEKLQKKAMRFGKNIANGNEKKEIALCASIGMKGNIRFDTYEKNAKILHRVGNFASLGHLYLEAIMREGEKCGAAMRVSFDPIFPNRVDALEFTQSGEVFVLDDNADVNIRRFIDEERLRQVRGEMRRATAQKKAIMALASDKFAEIREAHFALEEIFSAAMNFCRKEQFTEEFCRSLF